MLGTVRAIALAVAALCAALFYLQYLRFFGEFEGGRYIDPETGRTFVERAGLMWGSLVVIALLVAFFVGRR